VKALACALIVTALLTGCARMRTGEGSASPPMDTTTDKVACQQSGGKWNDNTRNCDR